MGTAGTMGTAGATTLVSTSAETAGANCAHGGVKFEVGIDADGNGALDAAEVTAALTRYACNGAEGVAGAQGMTGPAGATGAAGTATLTRTTAEAAGANCATGGVKLDVGADANADGTLDASEINASLTRYVCNGAQGTQGEVGATGSPGTPGATGAAGADGLNTVAATAAEAAGANCATGGVRLQFGRDTNGNNTLDAAEVTAALTRYVCNGAQGATGTAGAPGATGATGAAGRNTVAATAAEPAGANCATGGVRLQFGVDANGNNTLDSGEVTAALTRYVCNGGQGPQGIQGTTGATGATGAAGRNAAAASAAEPAGANCATGGTRLQFGTDTNGNGALDSGEVNAALTRYVCNGAQGPQGLQGVQGNVGGTGPAGPQGPTGPQGPAGPSSGYRILDNNNVVLGNMVNINRNSVGFITSAGYYMVVRWDGTMQPAQVYYSGTGCTGTPLLNSGGSADIATSRWLQWVGSRGELMAPSPVGNGVVATTTMTANSIDNPACNTFGSPTTYTGWTLQTVTASSAGLPRLPPFAGPLKLQ